MLHVPALPGSPFYQGNWKNLLEFVLRDAETLQQGGVDGLFIENYGDLPFYPEQVPHETVAHLAVIARQVVQTTGLPLGVNVLRNDAFSALAVAKAVGARWVRVNILTGARLTDQGIVQGKAHDLLRYRKKIGASDVKIVADISVKSSYAIANRSLEAEVEETVLRSGADGLIVSGASTGKPVSPRVLQTVKELAGSLPVWIGSGAHPKNVKSMSRWADGFIVGSSLKPRLDAPIEKKRVQTLIHALRGKKFS
ncbi:phosphorybosylanthranilate isomerase [bacterium]|nr:phosphorybosylanthranilate isomerase [bacterium]NBX81878.1 phosphorybosylanthranilate isomerase [bacterium]